MSNQLGVKGTGSQFATDDNTPPTGSVGTAQIATDAVTNVKLADMAAYTTKANPSAGATNPVDATRDQMSMMLDAYLRASQIARGSGLIAENMDRRTINGGSTWVSGTVYFQAIPLLAGETITNIVIGVSTGSNGATLSKCGIYSKAGVRLALSADQGLSWELPTNGMKTVPLTAPYVVPASDLYYIATISIATTTAVTPFRTLGTQAQLALMSGVPLIYGTMLAQTDLPANATIVSTSALSYWCAVS